MDSKESSVQFCSVPDLFLKLCSSMLCQLVLQSGRSDWVFHKPGKPPFSLEWRRLQHESKRLRRLCLDLVLLRQWEWISTVDHPIESPISSCLGRTLSFWSRGRSTEADKLSCNINWLASGKSGLTESENLLHFLFLLSSPCSHGGRQIMVPGTGQSYPHYPRYSM